MWVRESGRPIPLSKGDFPPEVALCGFLWIPRMSLWTLRVVPDRAAAASPTPRVLLRVSAVPSPASGTPWPFPGPDQAPFLPRMRAHISRASALPLSARPPSPPHGRLPLQTMSQGTDTPTCSSRSTCCP